MNSLEVSCKSVEEFEQRLNASRCIVRQLSKGKFSSYSHEFRLNDTCINRRVCDSDIQMDVQIHDHTSVLILQMGESESVVNGTPMKNTSVNLLAPGESLNMVHRNSNAITLVLNNDRLNQYSSEEKVTRWLANAEKMRKNCFPRVMYKAYAASINRILNTAQDLAELDDSFVAVQDFEAEIYNYISSIQDILGEQQPDRSRNRYRVVQMAKDLIVQNPDKSWSSPQIASYCHCSVRTLEYSFRTVLNCSVKQFIISLRLNAIYRELLKYEQGEVSISSLVKRFGVVNAGRFSKDYQQFFGEYPRDTLKRQSKVA